MAQSNDGDTFQAQHRCHIDKHLLPCKIALFLYDSVQGLVLAYSNAFLESVGLPPDKVGVVSAISYIVAGFAGPCWGLIADKTGSRKLVMILLCIGAALVSASTPWVAGYLRVENNNCSNNSLNIPMIKDEIIMVDQYENEISTRNAEFDFNIETTHIIKPCKPRPSDTLFYSTLALSVLTYSFVFPIEGVLNSIIMNIIKTSQTKQGYGEQRMFGAIGVGITLSLTGILADHFKHPMLSKYSVLYFVMLPQVVFLFILSYFLFNNTNWNDEAENTQQSSGSQKEKNVNVSSSDAEKIELMKVAPKALKNVDLYLIITTTLFAGLGAGTFAGFGFITVQDNMNGTASAMGFASAVCSTSSTIMFFFTERMIKLLHGPIICIEVGMVSWFIRLFTFSFIRNAWLAAAPHILQAFSYSLFTAAVVKYIHQTAPKKLYITMFTIIGSLQFSGGGFLGNMVGGKIYKLYGGPWLFRSVSFLSAGWSVVLIFYFHGIKPLKRIMKDKMDRNQDKDIDRYKGI